MAYNMLFLHRAYFRGSMASLPPKCSCCPSLALSPSQNACARMAEEPWHLTNDPFRCQVSLVRKKKRCDTCKHWRMGPAAEDRCCVRPYKGWHGCCLPPALPRPPFSFLVWYFLLFWCPSRALQQGVLISGKLPTLCFHFHLFLDWCHAAGHRQTTFNQSCSFL